MTSATAIPRYGVTQQMTATTDVQRAAEKLSLLGYAVLESGYSATERAEIETHFDALAQKVHKQYGTETLKAIDEHNSIRAPLTYDNIFLKLAQNSKVLELCQAIFRGNFILNQQNGVINPPQATYNQGYYHRDLPYQHFVVTPAIAINALYCVDAFTHENGCTKVVPASHKQGAFPSDETIREVELPVEAPAGSFIILDCMTYHSGGANKSNKARRAMNHVYTIPFIKQQIDFTALLSGQNLPAETVKLLDIGTSTPPQSVEEYYSRRMKKQNQIAY